MTSSLSARVLLSETALTRDKIQIAMNSPSLPPAGSSWLSAAAAGAALWHCSAGGF